MDKMLKDNITAVLNEIKYGNNLGEKISLVGATKFVNIDTINLAISYGLQIVAENKVQEFREKTDKIIGAEQHFIGHLQTNKIKYIVGKVALIHSVDTMNLAKEISNFAVAHNLVQDILLEVNIANENSKHGFSIDDLSFQISDIALLQGIKIKGLMAMLPNTQDDPLKQHLCIKMRNIYDKLKKENFDMQYLSLGMSNDYKIAIANGSNMIRLGTKLFGARNYGGY